MEGMRCQAVPRGKVTDRTGATVLCSSSQKKGKLFLHPLKLSWPGTWGDPETAAEETVCEF